MPKRDEDASAQVKVRLKEPLRAALEEAARKRGISMNAEVISRLERSFEQDQRLQDVFGSAELFRLAQTLALVMEDTRRLAGFGGDCDTRWLRHPFAYDQAVKAVNVILEALRPSGEIVQPRITLDEANRHLEPLLQERVGRIGESVAATMVEICSGTYTTERLREGKNLREGLGFLADKLQQRESNK
jgi:Arc-like DNA binding domain